MPLTKFTIDRAVARDDAYKLADGGGLHLLVQPNGGKLWRFRYRFAGRENTLALGTYPATPLADARRKRDDAKRLLEDGIDPAQRRRLDKLAAANAARNTFGAIATEHLENMVGNGAAGRTLSKYRWLLFKLSAPLVNRPITEITPAEILDILKRVEKSGRRETARKLRGVMGSVFRHAIVTLRATTDPTFPLRGALLKPNVQHRAAITDERQLGALMLAIDDYDGWPAIRAALLLLALTMTRPGDVRGMRRSEINFEKALWRIPAERMKMRRPHDVPLSRQALEIFRDIWFLSDHSELVLPSVRSNSKPLSDNTLNVALRRMGYGKDETVAHGFRSSASTILNERHFDPDVIEAALAHQDRNAIRRVYNRTTYLPERIRLMQAWADMLDEFRTLSIIRRHAA